MTQNTLPSNEYSRAYAAIQPLVAAAEAAWVGRDWDTGLTNLAMWASSARMALVAGQPIDVTIVATDLADMGEPAWQCRFGSNTSTRALTKRWHRVGAKVVAWCAAGDGDALPRQYGGLTDLDAIIAEVGELLEHEAATVARDIDEARGHGAAALAAVAVGDWSSAVHHAESAARIERLYMGGAAAAWVRLGITIRQQPEVIATNYAALDYLESVNTIGREGFLENAKLIKEGRIVCDALEGAINAWIGSLPEHGTPEFEAWCARFIDTYCAELVAWAS